MPCLVLQGPPHRHPRVPRCLPRVPGRSVPPATVARSAALRPHLVLQVRTWPRGLQVAFSFFPQTHLTGPAFPCGLLTPPLSRGAMGPDRQQAWALPEQPRGPGTAASSAWSGDVPSHWSAEGSCGRITCHCPAVPAVSAFLPPPRGRGTGVRGLKSWRQQLLLLSLAVRDEGGVVSPIVTPAPL